MHNPSDDLDTRVLSDLNSRTLVDGAAIDPALIAAGVGLSPAQLRESLSRLQAAGCIRIEADGAIGLTAIGHQRVSPA